MALSNAAKAGAAIFMGAVQFVAAEILAEIYYPGYSVSANVISDLGATCNNTCVVQQPSSMIFTSSVILLGAATLVSALFLQRAFRQKNISVLVGIAGVGVLGVAFFPESTGMIHGLFSLIAFLFGGLSALVAFRLQKPPLSYASLVLGLIALAALVLYVGGIYLGLDKGGMERMIAYPVLLWFIGFGGHLMGMADLPVDAPG